MCLTPRLGGGGARTAGATEGKKVVQGEAAGLTVSCGAGCLLDAGRLVLRHKSRVVDV